MEASINVILSALFFTHAAPHHHTPTAVLQCQDHAFTVGVLTRFLLNMLDHAGDEQIYLGLMRPKNALPTFIRFLAVLCRRARVSLGRQPQRLTFCNVLRTSELSQKLLSYKTSVPNQKHLPICSSELD